MITGDPVAIHWSDKKGRAHVTRGLLVFLSENVVVVSQSDGMRQYVPWPKISKVRKIT